MTSRSDSGIRQRAEQNGIDDTEDGGVRSNPEREREDGNQGEGRAFQKLPQGVAQVGDHKMRVVLVRVTLRLLAALFMAQCLRWVNECRSSRR